MGRDEDSTRRYHSRDDHSSRKRDSPSENPRDSKDSHKRRRTSHSPVDRDARSANREDAKDRQSSRRHRHHDHSSSHKRKHDGRDKSSAPVVELPFSARPLSKTDLPTFRSLFAYFLDLQKQIAMEDLDEREVKGRWKSFVGKWNRGELAEGWYDPDMFARVAENEPAPMPKPSRASPSPDVYAQAGHRETARGSEDEDGDDDDYGPVLPGSTHHGRHAGPGIPSLQDLSVRNEMLEEDREDSRNELRAARKADRALQKERLDEILPRADAGTRERQLEKRQMVNEKMREFRDKSPGVEGGNERDLMGGGDELEEFKREKEKRERKKSEREIRREEMDRARREEIEERRKAWAEREEGTVSMLRELAKQRFG